MDCQKLSLGWLSLVVLAVSLLSLTATATIPPEEQAALISLYNASQGWNWYFNRGWLVNDNYCEWYGVGCDPDQETVLRLNLNLLGYLDENCEEYYFRIQTGNNLKGPLPVELGNLVNLEFLDLSRNELSGPIPTELGNLKKLEWLLLYDNELSGTIPSEIGNLIKLREINLALNQLSGPFPHEFGNLTNLHYLRLDHNQLTGSIPIELGNLRKLRQLFLNANQLSGNIPSELGVLTQLHFLSLGHNQLSGTIPSELGSLFQLRQLSLDHNQFINPLPSELEKLRNLGVLRLDSDILEGAIPSNLGSLSRLHLLRMDNNQLSGTIPSELRSLQWLSELRLNLNQLSGIIPPELGQLKRFLNLNLASNQLSGSIPDQLKNFASWPPWLGKSLSIADNDLSGGIPTELAGLGHFQLFNLSYNQLSGPIPSEFGITYSSWLRTDLLLSSNRLDGEIPSELGLNTTLRTLFVDNNRLSGGLPSEIGNLSNLERLCVQSNQLIGEVPTTLQNLTGLYENESDFRWNGFSTDDPNLQVFLDTVQAGSDWTGTQTIAPADLVVDGVSDTTVDLTWSPIEYQDNEGGYEVWVGTYSGGPYSYYGKTASKDESNLVISGLDTGTTYWFTITTVTEPHGTNQNVVRSAKSEEAMATTTGPTPTASPAGTITPTPTVTPTPTSTATPTPTSTPETIPQSERDALIAVHTQLINIDSCRGDVDDTWLGPPGSECTWWGVHCAAGNTTVIELNLYDDCPGYGMVQGTLPSELSNLPNLRSVTIKNRFWDYYGVSGPIPAELGTLIQLVNLELQHNELSGPIPSELGNLAKLHYLHLDRNNLTGPIPAQFGNLFQLKELFLHGNNLDGPLPLNLTGLPQLEVLNLCCNELTGTIPVQYGDFLNLQYLVLSRNELGGIIPTELGNLTNLELLYLQKNELEGSIPTELSNLQELVHLRLDQNVMSGPLPSELGLLTNLETLFVAGNMFHGPIPAELLNLEYLPYWSLKPWWFEIKRGLDLRWNALYTEDAQLRHFLNKKQIFGDWESTQTIAPTDLLVWSPTTTSVLVSWTPISYTDDTGGYEVYYGTISGGPYTLFDITADKSSSEMTLTGLAPDTVHYVVVQTVTYAHANNQNEVRSELSAEVSVLTGGPTPTQTLTPTVTPTPTITPTPTFTQTPTPSPTPGVPLDEHNALIAIYNSTQGSNWTENSNWLTHPDACTWYGVDCVGFLQQKSVQRLELPANNLVGTLPSELEDLSNCWFINFQKNSLTGPIPAALGNLASIARLDLSENAMSGPLPTTLSNLKSLWRLDVSHNQLNGPFPTELWEMSGLVSLDLSYNEFSGPLPTTLGNLIYLEKLDLGHNRLWGSIPSEMGNCRRLQWLDVGSNALVGPLPDELQDLTELFPGQVDLAYSGLYTDDETLRSFLNSVSGDWERTQTVAPSDVTVQPLTETSLQVYWTPIRYSWDPGGYEVYYGSIPGGPYQLWATTPDKWISYTTIEDLKPDTTYYITVGTVTYPHSANVNEVRSELSPEVASTTYPVPTLGGVVGWLLLMSGLSICLLRRRVGHRKSVIPIL